MLVVECTSGERNWTPWKIEGRLEFGKYKNFLKKKSYFVFTENSVTVTDDHDVLQNVWMLKERRDVALVCYGKT